MKYVKYLLISFALFLFLPTGKAYAAPTCSEAYQGFSISTSLTQSGWPAAFHGAQSYTPFTTQLGGLRANQEYEFACRENFDGNWFGNSHSDVYTQSFTTDASGNATVTINSNECFNRDEWDHKDANDNMASKMRIKLRPEGLSECDVADYIVIFQSSGATCTSLNVSNTRESNNPTCFMSGDQVYMSAQLDGANPGSQIDLMIGNREESGTAIGNVRVTLDGENTAQGTISLSTGDSLVGEFLTAYVRDPMSGVILCQQDIGGLRISCSADGDPIVRSEGTDPFNLCNQVPGKPAAGEEPDPNSEYAACDACLNRNRADGGSGIWTSVGCISTDGTGIVTALITIALGMAGGIGLLMIIAAGAMFSMSRNDPKKVGDAKEMLSSVVIGLIFIVFSVTVLQFIGVTILQIPGFGN